MIQPNCQTGFPPASGASVGATGGTSLVSRLRQSELFRDYQQAFEASTGLPLVLRETGSFQTPLQGSPQLNPFCALMTQANHTCAACLQLQQRAEVEATLAARTLRCYAGLVESAVPVRIGHQVIGYLQTGQVFLRRPSRRQFNAVVRTMPPAVAGTATPAWEPAYFRTRVVNPAKYESIIRLLAIFAQHLAVVSNQLLLTETVVEVPVITKGRAFIAEHLGEHLRLCDVARAVHMTDCYFCKIFKKATGLGFIEYLSRARVESAKHIMLNAHTRIGEAAFAAGFQSLSQFNRVFRRITGDTPSRYRERLHGVNAPPARKTRLVAAA